MPAIARQLVIRIDLRRHSPCIEVIDGGLGIISLGKLRMVKLAGV
jgi:hypothetical protein